jgi:hypothetical protein
MWILANLKLLSYGLAAIALIGLLLTINHWRVKANQLDEAKTALSSCQSNATKLKGINDELRDSRDDTASKLRTYKLRQQNCSILLADAKQAGARPAGGNASAVATSDDLYDFAAVCRNYWVERQLLEKLVSQQ